MGFRGFVLAASVAILGLTAGPGPAEASRGACHALTASTEARELSRLYLENDLQPLVIVGTAVYLCSCGSRDFGGDTEGRSLAGATEGRSLGGDKEARSLGGDSEARSLGGDSEGRSLGGDSEARSLGGGSEARSLGGDSEARSLGGDKEGRSFGGDSEDRSLGGATGTFTCSIQPSCGGFVFHDPAGRTLAYFDGESIKTSNGRCVL